MQARKESHPIKDGFGIFRIYDQNLFIKAVMLSFI